MEALLKGKAVKKNLQPPSMLFDAKPGPDPLLLLDMLLLVRIF